jgi:hypothetical protein
MKCWVMLAFSAGIVLVACGSRAGDGRTEPQAPALGPSATIEASGPVYSTIEALADASDAMVYATVAGKDGVVLDGDSHDPAGLVPMAVWKLKVESSVSRNAPVGSEISLAVLDSSVGVTDWVSPLKPGDHLAVFLQQAAPTTAAWSKIQRPIFVLVSGDNGVFDVTPAGLQARSVMVETLRNDQRQTATTEASARVRRTFAQTDVMAVLSERGLN